MRRLLVRLRIHGVETSGIARPEDEEVAGDAAVEPVVVVLVAGLSEDAVAPRELKRLVVAAGKELWPEAELQTRSSPASRNSSWKK